MGTLHVKSLKKNVGEHLFFHFSNNYRSRTIFYSFENQSCFFLQSLYDAHYISLYFSRDGDNLDAGTETNANLNHELYYHFLATEQSEDILCWNDPDNPKHTRSASVTEDGQVMYFLVYSTELRYEPDNYCIGNFAI